MKNLTLKILMLALIVVVALTIEYFFDGLRLNKMDSLVSISGAFLSYIAVGLYKEYKREKANI
jgi:hypothetical protein